MKNAMVCVYAENQNCPSKPFAIELAPKGEARDAQLYDLFLKHANEEAVVDELDIYDCIGGDAEATEYADITVTDCNGLYVYVTLIK